jgi:hypothetical protein
VSPTAELVTGIVMGGVFVALGAVTGFTAPTEAEAAADPATLRWARRPRARRRVGIVIIAMGILLAALHIARAMMMR